MCTSIVLVTHRVGELVLVLAVQYHSGPTFEPAADLSVLCD